MILLDRDRQLLALLGDFGLLTSKQIHGLVFPDVSTTMSKRAIDRLYKTRLITRLDFRLSGNKGGAGSYIYKLSQSGQKLHRPGENYRELVTNWAHTLEISETFLHLKQLEHAGTLVIDRYDVEPRRMIGTAELRPDLYVEITQGTRRRAWDIEIDLSTERAPQLRKKLEAVVKAVDEARRVGVSHMPLTVWIAPDVRRAALLTRLVSELPDGQDLFVVTTTGGLGRLLL
jgi:hypothetical protein